MAKIDCKNQVVLPKDLIVTVNKNFDANVYVYVKGNRLFLDNPSPENYHIPCLCKIKFYNGRRFLIPVMVRSIFNLNIGDELDYYIL